MRYTILRILAVAFFILLPDRFVFALRLPTDTELRAAYCMPVVAADADFYRKAISQLDQLLKSEEQLNNDQKNHARIQKIQKSLAEMQQYLVESQVNMRRLELYTAPRIYELDASLLLIAVKRAEEDLDMTRSMAKACVDNCSKSTDLFQCTSSCGKSGNEEIKQRFQTCRNLSWLPF